MGLLVTVTVACLMHVCAGLSKSACFSPLNTSIDLDCGADHMVHITKTFYGYSPSRQCHLVEAESAEVGGAGCIVAEQNVQYGCVGQRTCQVNLPKGQWGITVPGCGQRSNYFQVEYTCVPASSVANICSTGRLTAPSGYISTPNYPSNYHHPGTCATTIHAHPSQKLTLHIIDMELESPGTADCQDFLYFNDKLRSITVCGSRNNNTYRMHSNYLHVELQSTSGGKSKGFWLYYEANPPIPTSLQPPSDDVMEPVEPLPQTDDSANQEQELTHDSAPASTPRPWYPRSTVPLIRTSSKSSDPLPFALIAGVVIGSLSLILIILLLLLLVKWLKERRYNKVEKCLEIRNPAFRSSADFCESQQGGSAFPNNNYYC